MARTGMMALSVAVLLALFEIGSCIRCYQCNSQSDPTCGDPFKGTHSVECSSPEAATYNQNYLSTIFSGEILSNTPGAPKYCHKIVLGTGTVVRTCLDTNPSNTNQVCRALEDMSKSVTMDKMKMITHCSTCDKDNCNGASSISFSFPLAALAFVASYMYSRQ